MVFCVKRLIFDVVFCVGKNWVELYIDFFIICMYMYYIILRRDFICYLRKVCSLFYGIIFRYSIYLYFLDLLEFIDLVYYSYMIVIYDYFLKIFFLFVYIFLINVIFFCCRIRIGF